MSVINTIKGWIGLNVNVNTFERQADAIVTEFNEVTNNPAVEDRVEATIDSVERISESGVFHTYSVARIDFDLGDYGSYPVEVALPRFPEEESEIEEFMNRLGYEVQDLPRLEEGEFTVPFVRVDGEWQINWDEVVTDEEFGYEEEVTENDTEENEVEE